MKRPGFSTILLVLAVTTLTLTQSLAGAPSAATVAPVGLARSGVASHAEVASSMSTALAQASPGETACTICHGDPELFEPELMLVLEGYEDDVHGEVGLSCHDCHGGNPDPALAEDMSASMDPRFATNPYLGVPDAVEVPGFCGRCHSDPTYMRRFNPSARVDQAQEYWTSQHGVSLSQGDENVATCVSCHGVHGIRRPGDPHSMVYPTQVVDTCSNCHADASVMAGYVTANGQPLPVDQAARWRESVHAAAMFEREDLSAPTCNDCHGNHGATPPGLDSITYICGQCHGREANLFRASVKRTGFEEHNDYLLDIGDEGCAACHTSPEPQAAITDIHSFGECASCHGNHGVVRPSLAFLSPLPETPCAFCHEGADAPSREMHEPEGGRTHYEEAIAGLLATAAEQGIEGEERYDWLVDQALVLPTHTLGPAAAGETPQLRPEFDRLFTRFRIGRTSFTYEDPVTGETARAPILRCGSCHASEEILGEDAHGRRVSAGIVNRMRQLTVRTAEAERINLRARRGGVEARDISNEIDQSVDAQIQLEVLLHSFDVDEDSEFVAAFDAGMEHATAALAAGQEALDELAFRRRGLVVALAVIILVLVALGLKIRELSVRDAARESEQTPPSK
jgi:hypothetical protein